MPTVLGLTNETKESSQGTKPNSAATNSSKTMGKNERLDTISKRNHAAAHEMETLLWRAICDSPEAAKEYLAEDCIMVNPIFSPDRNSKPLSKDTEPNIEAVLKGAERFTGFRFHGKPLVVEVDLMAVALVYKLSLFRLRKNGRGEREIVASGSSTWRQTAGADWLLVAQHVQYAEEDDDDDEDDQDGY
ncbi:hypothetical protein QBC42DRAFT_278271 [Cladorrhinum samala]|uniref:DUF4440 domain-containing protein n=1 Tax=Cladorrhinum samala TaxID=585594 RepID=A0AAV9HC14_9PEZI|nr:hypothetical protein QBC42DRAFT_278271 [Cladorrhinum samala]